MNIKQAQMLETLERTLSLSLAATELGTSQPRLTQQLKAVEVELGTDLFNRSPRGLTVTPAGTTFLPFAKQLIETYGEAQEALTVSGGTKTSHLRVGASITASYHHAPDNILMFHKRYPDVLVTVTRTVPGDLVKGLEEGRLDLCLGLELPESSLFMREEIFKTRLVGLSSTAAKTPAHTSVARFCESPLVLAPRSCDTRILLDDALRRAHIKPRVVLEADDVTTVLALVRAGVAQTILPRTLAANSKTLRVSDFSDLAVEVNGTLLYPRTCRVEARNFIRVVKERVKKDKDL